jgi:hypothetical protein
VIWVYKISYVLIGFIIGVVNWYLLFRSFRMMVLFSMRESLGLKDKLKITLMFLIKMVFIFGSIYLVIGVLNLPAIWLVSGIVLSLAGMVFVLYKKSH